MPIEIILPDEAAWKAERRNGIGASDAAALLGMSPWKTNVQLWEEKVGLREPDDISDEPYVQYGKVAEEHLRALFALDHPEMQGFYDSPYKIVRNGEYPFIQASPDGELVELATMKIGWLEIKTSEIKQSSQWTNWKGQIPQYYYTQVIWQMIAAELDFVILKAQLKWTDKDGAMRLDTREYRVERADVEDDIEYAVGAAIQFWKNVQEKRRPNLILPHI